MSVLSRHHRAPGGPRSQRRHLAQPQRQGLYRRAFFEAFRKLDPRQVVRNPVMFVVWLGTVLTFLLVLDPGLFGSSNEPGARSFNALICLTLFLTVWFANAAEAIAEGRGKAQADALRATQTQTLARRLTAGGTVESVNSPDRKSVV